MKMLTHFKEALVNLSSSKLRSLLALLGILVGTASVVAMVSGGELATNEALKQFKVLGTDLLAVSINENSNEDRLTRGADATLNLADAMRLKSVDKAIIAIAPYTQVYSAIRYQGKNLDGSILGVTESFARMVHIEIARGRFISNFDNHALFCVVGNQLYEQMKKISFGDPINQQIQLGDSFFTIIGVAKPWPENSFVYANIDYSILVPLLSTMTLSQHAEINNIILQLIPNANIENVDAKITKYIKQVLPDKRLFVRSAKELISSMGKQDKILTVFLGLIGSISLLVGGIGVMNIMLVSITERRREIGIRLAVGARRIDIRHLFLIEAVMLSLVGGSAGVIIGMIIAYVLALIWHWEFILFLWPPLIGFSVSVAVGIFFGYYPAYKASQLDPIEALRSE
jgi:putative ABC transport system permease protein